MWDVGVDPVGGEHRELLLDLFDVVRDVVQDLDGHFLPGRSVQGLKSRRRFNRLNPFLSFMEQP